MYVELIERCDLPSFLDCHIRAFDFIGGVSEQILYDRMKNVLIRELADRKIFNDTLLGFALHYGFKPESFALYRFLPGLLVRWAQKKAEQKGK